jgi:UrcA family protein
MPKHLVLATAAALALTAAPALAAGESWRVGNNTYHVYLDDLDLRSPAGRANALARVEKAAERLCARAGTRSEQRACQKEILEAVTGAAGGAVRLALSERSQQQGLALARAR